MCVLWLNYMKFVHIQVFYNNMSASYIPPLSSRPGQPIRRLAALHALKNMNNSRDTPTKITDLPAVVIRSICEYLDHGSFINFYQTNNVYIRTYIEEIAKSKAELQHHVSDFTRARVRERARVCEQYSVAKKRRKTMTKS